MDGQKLFCKGTQKVNINGEESDWMDIISGVPQGSVLGPVLFVVYINDLPEEVLSALLLYADDAKIFRDIKCPKDVEMLQNDLHMMSTWSENWLLKFHPKLEKLTITNKKHVEERIYYAGEYIVKKSTSEKDIGVHIDNYLNFGVQRKKKIQQHA